jgi:thioredoxin reductase (NADPH)
VARPVLFVLDDDAGVVGALRGDISRRFSQDFRVLGESSADAGLAILRPLAEQADPVALLIVDHHLSGTPGLDFLVRAHDLHPSAKRVLLVERDYSVRSPVVRAMTLGQADYHLTKPWMLEQDLYEAPITPDAPCSSPRIAADAATAKITTGRGDACCMLRCWR